MLNKKGFTLVELLAVIVILAIILVIAVPKVMSIIDDSKKSTLETTVKMIASAAEKRKIQNNILNDNTNISCDDVAKLNNIDYEQCNIKFYGNKAKVSISGSGKFNGLHVCNGTKNTVTVSNKECDNSGVAYINELFSEENTLHNGLIMDDTDEKNIRYSGEKPNNYIYFNCDKEDINNVSYGEETYDYAGSCELWRIIGIFDVLKTVDGEKEKRIKIIREPFIDSNKEVLEMSWDSSASTINKGWGINEWSQSDLKTMLNTYYLGTTTTCKYCTADGQTNCDNDCASIIKPLSEISQKMVENAVWNIRGVEEKEYTLKEIYNSERKSEQTGKICSSTNSWCNDNVDRTKDWEGTIGLSYISDLTYASVSENCNSIAIGSNTCRENNWLNKDYWYWTISPYSYSQVACGVWYIKNGINYEASGFAMGVRPSAYLKSKVQIDYGSGSEKDPYILRKYDIN